MSKRFHWLRWISGLTWLVVCQLLKASTRIGMGPRKCGLSEEGQKQCRGRKYFTLWPKFPRKSHQQRHIFRILWKDVAFLSVSNRWFRDYCLNAQIQGWVSLDCFMIKQNKVSPNFTWHVGNTQISKHWIIRLPYESFIGII